MILVKLIIYSVLIALFLVIPLGIGILYKFIIKKYWKWKSRYIVGFLVLIQLLLLSYFYFQPILTYDATIPQSVIEENGAWAREKLEGPWVGFYSSNIPILAYRFNIISLSNSNVAANIYYFPIGKIQVEWDGLYNIIKPLTGL